MKNTWAGNTCIIRQGVEHRNIWYTQPKLCFATLGPTEYEWTTRLKMTNFHRGHNATNTTDNKSIQTQLTLLHLYVSKKRYNISFTWYFIQKYWFSSVNVTVSKACECSTKGRRFEPSTTVHTPFLSKFRNLSKCKNVYTPTHWALDTQYLDISWTTHCFEYCKHRNMECYIFP